MKRLKRFSAVLLVAGLVFGFTGCPTNGDEGDFAQYFDGNFRENWRGTTEVRNETNYDMLLFNGTITRLNVVGGVRANNRANLNFSGENNWMVGGWMLLHAVRQCEFAAFGNQSRVDHSVMVTFGEGRRYVATIYSTNQGNFEFVVNNQSRDFGLELRLNSPQGEVLAFLTAGESRRVLQFPDNNIRVIYPVWVAFNTRTRSVVTFSPAATVQDPGRQEIMPVPRGGDTVAINFPMGANTPIVFEATVPFATLEITNNTGMLATFRNGNMEIRSRTNSPAVNTGGRDTFEIPRAGGAFNPNMGMDVGRIAVPVRFADDAAATTVEIQNGYFYRVNLRFRPGGEAQPNDAASYEAILTRVEAISTTADFESP